MLCPSPPPPARLDPPVSLPLLQSPTLDRQSPSPVPRLVEHNPTATPGRSVTVEPLLEDPSLIRIKLLEATMLSLLSPMRLARPQIQHRRSQSLIRRLHR